MQNIAIDLKGGGGGGDAVKGSCAQTMFFVGCGVHVLRLIHAAEYPSHGFFLFDLHNPEPWFPWFYIYLWLCINWSHPGMQAQTTSIYVTEQLQGQRTQFLSWSHRSRGNSGRIQFKRVLVINVLANWNGKHNQTFKFCTRMIYRAYTYVHT